MKNERGFTLVELLAVIVIITILMFLAIPAVTRYVQESRLKAFTEDAKTIASSVKSNYASGGYDILTGVDANKENKVTYSKVAIDSILVNKLGKSPFGGNYKDAGVFITKDEKDGATVYQYYVCLLDDSNHAFEYTNEKQLKPSNIEFDSKLSDCVNNQTVSHTVAVTVTGGIIKDTPEKRVLDGDKVTFKLGSDIENYAVKVTCTNDQKGRFDKNNEELIVSKVKSDTVCNVLFRPTEFYFPYTGDVQDFVPTANGYWYVELHGASGGGDSYGGAKASGYIYLEEDKPLYVYVGEYGNKKSDCNIGHTYNGGGIGMSGANKCEFSGGGATDLRLVKGSDWSDRTSLKSRIMVASGGAGDTANEGAPALGATLYGANYSKYDTTSFGDGGGGSQTDGGLASRSSAGTKGTDGSFGMGGAGGTGTRSNGAGGGSGYYGGAGGNGDSSSYGNGGGGSSYISGYAGVNSITGDDSLTSTTSLKHYSNKYFVGAELIASQNYYDSDVPKQILEGIEGRLAPHPNNHGHGWGKAKWIGEEMPQRINKDLDNVRFIKNCISGSTASNENVWTEIQAVKNGENIAKNMLTGTYSVVTDGKVLKSENTVSKESVPSSYNKNTRSYIDNKNCITVDLRGIYNLDEIALWNYFGDQRRFYENDLMVSSNGSSWINLSKDEVWRETSDGARYNAYIDHVNGYSGRDKIRVWYDGYANNGGVRKNTMTSWKNLIDNNFNGKLKEYPEKLVTNGTDMWGNTYIQFHRTQERWINIGLIDDKKPTVEAVFSPIDNHWGDYVTLNDGTKEEIVYQDVIGNFQIGGYGIELAKGNILSGDFHISGGYRGLKDNANVINPGQIVSTSITYDLNTRKLYKYGVLLKSGTEYTGEMDPALKGTVAGQTDNPTPMVIGTNPNGNTADQPHKKEYFYGKVYSARVYNGVLTDQQIKHNYIYDSYQFHLK